MRVAMTTSVFAGAHRDIAISDSSSLKLSDSASAEPSSTTAIGSEHRLPKSSSDGEVCHSAAPFSSSANVGRSNLTSEDSATPSKERPTSEELPSGPEGDNPGTVRVKGVPRPKQSGKDDEPYDFVPAQPVGQVNHDESDGDENDEDESDGDKSNVPSEIFDERVKKASKRLNQYSKYVQLMEDRVSHLEEKFRKLESSDKPVKPLPPLTENSRSTIPELKYVKWNEFKNKYARDKELYAIEVLTGGARYWYQRRMDDRMRRMKARGDQATAANINDPPKAEPETYDELPERIRINSPALLAILSDISLDVWTKPVVFLTPYKLLVHHDSEIREFCTRLESKFSSKSLRRRDYDAFSEVDAAVPDPCLIQNEKFRQETMEEAEKMTDKLRGVGDSTDTNSTLTNVKREASNDLVGSREAFEDLKCLIKFMDRHLAPIIKQFRERTREYIQFHELWFLFNLGDIVYSPKKHEQMGSDTERAAPKSVSQERFQSYHTTYRVCGKQGGRPLVRRDGSESQPQLRDRVRWFGVFCYYIDYNGTSFIPVDRQFEIVPFEGKRKITSLEVYPLEYAENHAAIKHDSITKGVKFKSALSTKHMLYVGPTYITDPRGSRGENYPNAVEQINSEVIIDFAEAKNHQHLVFESGINWIYGRCTAEDDSDEFQEDYPTVVWSDYDEKVADKYSDDAIFKDSIVESRCAENNFTMDSFLKSVGTDSELRNNTHEPMRDEDIMLVTDRVVAYVLRERKFALLSVENMLPLNPNPDGFMDLKLPSGHKEMVQALVRSHSMKRDSNSRIKSNVDYDIVTGKGRGLIILLHGVPGVGKTSTAECVAESTGKPLFPITCGDLGLRPREVEESLKEIFQLAQLWDCVLLLDEADVFLSQRTKTDLQRNALVSGESDPLCGKKKLLTIIVFLRVLEYYQGILFLTTNRVGAFDEAFKSRIHISLYYPELAKVQSLKIWEMNLERAKKIDLERTRTQTMSGLIIDEEDIKSYAEIHWIENQNGVGKWNGRQIRNAFQTASALALYEAHMGNAKRLREDPDAAITPPRLTRKHFEKVAKATSQFGEYMRDTIGKDDADASHYRGDRTDHFRQKARAARQPVNPQIYSQPYTPPPLQQHYPRTPSPNFPTTRHHQAALHSGSMRSEPSPATEPYVDETHYYEYHDRTGGLGPMNPNVNDEMEYE